MLQSGYQSVDRELAAEFNLVVRAGSDYCGVNASESIGKHMKSRSKSLKHTKKEIKESESFTIGLTNTAEIGVGNSNISSVVHICIIVFGNC